MNQTPPPPNRRKIVRQSGERAYWLPGVEGIALEAALSDLVNYSGGARLVIGKRRVGAAFHYVFEIDKDKITN